MIIKKQKLFDLKSGQLEIFIKVMGKTDIQRHIVHFNAKCIH